MKVTIDLGLNGPDRSEIEGRMSAAMGQFVAGCTTTDLSAWDPHDWDRLVSIAFDVAAIEVMRKRVQVVGPCSNDDYVPF